jgi:hypothetical protein
MSRRSCRGVGSGFAARLAASTEGVCARLRPTAPHTTTPTNENDSHAFLTRLSSHLMHSAAITGLSQAQLGALLAGPQSQVQGFFHHVCAFVVGSRDESLRIQSFLNRIRALHCRGFEIPTSSVNYGLLNVGDNALLRFVGRTYGGTLYWNLRDVSMHLWNRRFWIRRTLNSFDRRRLRSAQADCATHDYADQRKRQPCVSHSTIFPLNALGRDHRTITGAARLPEIGTVRTPCR